ncbi:uncharacterized protein LOC129941407 [Eupeodes corollae]|uniref:uncharacterized protein LOC129941407 n=1 Tax=Eupeodes corollae TaxID=290404 RepID=UPI0024932DE1|nr:uncharacterized protein LOC129941407 [Eupeodes corollae]
MYNQNAEHELHTDASCKGLAGIFLQKEGGSLHLVAYYRRKTTKEESMYHSYELEALDVVEATDRFRQYLLGKHFLIVTDCEALKTASKKKLFHESPDGGCVCRSTIMRFLIEPALPNTQNKPVINFFMDLFFTFGISRRIISDKGTAFTSHAFEEFVKGYSIQYIQNATKTPRANGQVERYNRTILHALLATVDDETRWDQKVRYVQWGIKNTQNETTDKTAHELLMGYVPRDPLKDVLDPFLSLNVTFPSIDTLRTAAAESTDKRQAIQKRQHDMKHKKART